ncbi:hypothetical protein [Erwinia sp. Leaf53]|uniref:hypothetical protein n=1 Tax=Erwinia sp. Leaf53 TaxID=1736225 RepID=UPI0007017432|nr:hypothetical protein [Erwinia sp. Leaf53]KQN55487.1 hypothetical protein ASF13_08220 [Erwinia sp. Leaf53]
MSNPALFFLIAIFLCVKCFAANMESDLSKVSVFSMGYNGFYPKIMAQQKLYEEALSSENAVRIFEIILSDRASTPESKMYAFCGLRHKGVLLRDDDLKKFDTLDVNVLKADVITKWKFNALRESVNKNDCG